VLSTLHDARPSGSYCGECLTVACRDERAMELFEYENFVRGKAGGCGG